MSKKIIVDAFPELFSSVSRQFFLHTSTLCNPGNVHILRRLAGVSDGLRDLLPTCRSVPALKFLKWDAKVIVRCRKMPFKHILLSWLICPLLAFAFTDNQAAAPADQGSFPGLPQRRHTNCGRRGIYQCRAKLHRGIKQHTTFSHSVHNASRSTKLSMVCYLHTCKKKKGSHVSAI